MKYEKTFMGDALAFIQTLPMKEGRTALAVLNARGDLPKYLHKKFGEFLREQYHA